MADLRVQPRLTHGIVLIAAFLGAVDSPAPKAGQDRPVVEKLKLETELRPGPVRTRVWIPPAALGAGPGTIPLLIFLHDGYGSQRSFFRRGLDDLLEEAVASGEVPPMVVASPRTVGTFNSNRFDGTHRIEDFLATELVPLLRERYPFLRRDRRGTGVTGISMGGYGALKLALRNPELFGSASSLSTWVEDLSFEHQEERFWLMRLFMRRRFGKEREVNTIEKESLFRIIPEAGRAGGSFPPILLLSGKEDPWVINGNHARLDEALAGAGIGHETSLYPGRHEWDFWREHFLELVRFHLEAFD